METNPKGCCMSDLTCLSLIEFRGYKKYTVATEFISGDKVRVQLSDFCLSAGRHSLEIACSKSMPKISNFF